MLNLKVYSLSLIVLIFLTACSKDQEPTQTSSPKENWYTVSELSSETWIFEEKKSSQVNVSYLIAGSDKAIMFDSGTGENSGQDESKILYKIEETTSLPITLLLSHFHFDHNQNVLEFENVAFPDLSFLKGKVDEADLYNFSQEDLFLGTNPSIVEVSEWFPIEKDYDLGNRVIQFVNLPGHTDESVVILDHANKMAFLGDFLYSGELFVFDSNDLPIYLKSINRLIAMIDETYDLYGAHGKPNVSYQHLINAKNLLDCIVNSDCYTTNSANVFGKEATVYISEDQSAVIVLIHSD